MSSIVVTMTAPDGYVVTFAHGEKAFGAGVLVNRRFVLTAAHCLRTLPPGVRRVGVRVGSAEATGEIEEWAPDADLALIRIVDALPDSGVSLPLAGLCRPEDRWFAPYRPSLSNPHLDGTVVAESVSYHCVPGGTIDAIQLECRQHLGDYGGYSGSPVEKRFERQGELIGLLIEQVFDRAAPRRASNVLFAVSLREALRRFETLDVSHLAAALSIKGVLPADETPGRDRELLAATELKLRAIKQWADEGLLEPDEVPALRLRVAESILRARGEVEPSGR